MPKGTPQASKLWSGEISFFSIDTDLIQAAGYRFDEGALNQLPKQLPPSMCLEFSEVVVREVVKHMMEPVLEASLQLKSSAEKIGRITSADITGLERAIADLSIEKSAHLEFRKRVEDYANRCRGGVLEIANQKISADLFDLYFSSSAPFATSKNKKSEFPDAMSLLLLEQYAIENGAIGIVASGDEGWRMYAAESDHLYCVKSLDELTALFAATDEISKSVKRRLLLAVEDNKSDLRVQLRAELEEHVGNSPWDVNDIYTGSAYRVEGEVYGAKMLSYELNSESLHIWSVDGEPTSWVVELEAVVKVSVDVAATYFAWDSIDREEVSIGTDSFEKEEEIIVELYVSLSNVAPEVGPKDWEVEIEIGYEKYSVKVGEVNPDLGW
ncbi:PIN domain-containing protein [Pseudomonas sp. JH-2]|uniref:PIN domain-containing protein n=1 Tax=Pseudomonas sp. JH-2 TaxID=3114998 RepID=UPI002E2757E1|nr:PIN domain-containing protein [Pseudomonas sp. JH-2]